MSCIQIVTGKVFTNRKTKCMIDNSMTKTKASVRVLRQRAGGWCEPVQERIFPLSESVMKVTGSYPVSYVREVVPDHSAWQDGWQRGRICLSSQCFVHMGGPDHRAVWHGRIGRGTGREAFLCTRGGTACAAFAVGPGEKQGRSAVPVCSQVHAGDIVTEAVRGPRGLQGR